MDWEEFKKQPCFYRIDKWMDNQLIEEFYSPSLYNKKGELISEEKFNYEGLEEEKKTSFELAQKVYNIEKEYRQHNIYDKGIMEMCSIQIQGENIKEDLQKRSLLVISGLVFGIFVSELPHINKWKFLQIKHYEDLISEWFRDVSDEHEWLDFYFFMQCYLQDLPKELTTGNALYYWNKLRENLYLDYDYQFNNKCHKAAIKHLIAYFLNKKCQITYKYIEKFWKVKTLRDMSDFETLYCNATNPNNIAKRKFERERKDIYGIQDIFGMKYNL